MNRKTCLLDSSFVIDLLNEAADGQPGPAMKWLQQNPAAQLWISAVTWAEVMEGAENPDAVRAYLGRYRWQGIHSIHAEVVARLQKGSRHRMGENDAWQAAIVLHMRGSIVGHDAKAFSRLGDIFQDHRAPVP